MLRPQFLSRAHSKQFDDGLVLFLRQLLHRAASGLAHDTLGERPLQLRRDDRRSKNLPRLNHRWEQVLDEMLDAALTAPEMPLQARAQHAPPRAGSVAHRSICVLDAEHALLDQVQHFTIERRLEPICHVARQFLVETNRLLADGFVKGHGPPDRLVRRLRTADDFDERDDVRRIERVADQHALGVHTVRLHDARRDPRRARGDDRVDRRGSVNVCEQLHLEIRALRSVFLDEVGVGQRILQARRERQTIAGCAVRQADAGQQRPGFIDVLAKVGLGVRRWIGRDDVEAACEIVGGPARADDAGADDSNAVNRFVERHDECFLLNAFRVRDALAAVAARLGGEGERRPRERRLTASSCAGAGRTVKEQAEGAGPGAAGGEAERPAAVHHQDRRTGHSFHPRPLEARVRCPFSTNQPIQALFPNWVCTCVSTDAILISRYRVTPLSNRLDDRRLL